MPTRPTPAAPVKVLPHRVKPAPSAAKSGPRWLTLKGKRIGLLPVVIVAAVGLFGLKLAEVWTGETAPIGVAIKPAVAQQQQQPPAAAKPADAAKTDAAKDAKTEEADAKPTPPVTFGQTEVEMLQSLASRRVELEARTRELDLRENLLKAAEDRLEKKVAELKKIEATINGLLKKHDEEQEAKLKSLIKVYETMKPKEAAPIFNALDMPLLLDIVERMKEAKIAPIVALMETDKAKELSTKLASRRKLPTTGS